MTTYTNPTADSIAQIADACGWNTDAKSAALFSDCASSAFWERFTFADERGNGYTAAHELIPALLALTHDEATECETANSFGVFRLLGGARRAAWNDPATQRRLAAALAILWLLENRPGDLEPNIDDDIARAEEEANA